MAVLDTGSGSGFFSSYFVSKGCEVYSMDYSEKALSITQSITGYRCKAYIKDDILDIKSLSKIDKKFDIVFTDGLLEHYSRDEQDRIITNMRTVKREGGYLINFVPNRFSLWSMIRSFYIKIQERPFIMADFLDMHKRNGLDIISYGGINVLPFKISPEKLLGRYFGMLLYCIAV
jgi:SAM-dependent methyltransferase